MWVISLVLAAPTEGSHKYSEDIDLTKLYEPNPPVTHRVYMTVEYEDPLTEKPMRHNLNIDLYGTVVPLTVKNFAFLAKGVKARVEGQDPNQIHVITYRETLFTNVVIDSFMQGGIVAPAYGPFSIHGGAWADENFDLKHDRPGRVSMANKGEPDTNNSEFIFDTKTTPNSGLDNKNVVFGQISAGLKELIDIIQYVKKDTDGRPLKPFKIVWAVPDEFRLGEQKVVHQKYLDDLAAFRAGDSSKGVTLAESLAPVKVYTSKEATSDTVLYDSYSSSALKNILIVLAVIAVCFGLYNYKDAILRKNSKIVSMR
ncbi:similar to Saccharomyces cerevisiae YCR069W CPR4 Peptidyl-prolyl cis-trans isomerase (cyclophilin) [Maudiozyma saulgeensis]|uniref:Similar to Saccharomyces cerevisiae YCR069W CPR4 Peptidyl-prolyl cis-trans isomerase (Cyclophilin) n=1 Tax=Maudiozyma saulgeensis TaxID=1789683 RepID=A0A1X7R4P3_9SACH|nr:similar to Saccharomyces cerevisiae YCR069W CPR4 Peptidyl-prolyl cis-trans isomerase (cyclophilin) [Kazachstania saulgeensis]